MSSAASPSDIRLRYGTNPHQGSARVVQPSSEPLRVLAGEPSYINILDALTGWQLVRETARETGKVAAASYKHVSPAGAAVAGEVSDELARAWFLDESPGTPDAQAYVRARGADRVSSFGDAAAVSTRVGVELAEILAREVSDLIIAPAYESAALEILRRKKRGRYLVLEIDPEYEPPPLDSRTVFGLTLEQKRNGRPIPADLFRGPEGEPTPEHVVRTLVVATTALKYAQSNSVCLGWEGQVIGMAAGQQSRIHCTRLACRKAEKWMLQTHPRVLGLEIPVDLPRPAKANAVDQFLLWDELSEPERDQLRETLGHEPEPLTDEERADWFAGFDDLVMSSDAFIPFRDNVDRAARTGVRWIAQTGGSVRDAEVRAAADEQGITMIETGVRCFLH